MKTLLKITAAALAVGLTAPALHAADAAASAEAQAQEFRDFFFKRFPDIKPADYIYGVYALNEDARAQFDAMNEFPPYDEAIAKGKAFYSKPLANGKSLKDCLGDAKGLRAKYPFFDTETNKVRILEADLVQCAQAYGETKFDEKSKDLKAVSAYLASESRGMKVNVTIPNEKALAAFEEGKRRWFQKTGQLNLSCADCHQYHSGQRARSETLSPGIGKTAHFPVWRLKADGLVTLNDRLFGCVKDTRAKPYKLHGDEYRTMEYFLSYIDNGLEITGPAVRK
ncbi:MAG: sulfur oxidation c-type cytochrome SoxA [Pseudomonadota bacterium]